jgi:ATP-dependent exoDNAse (exonuclease V) alpha subunit
LHLNFDSCNKATIHTSQGKTFDNTIAAISDNKLLNNQKSWLVAISRHRNEMVAIVSDKSQLETQITKNKAIETSAIELVAQKELIDNQNDLKSLHQSQQNDIIKESKQVEVEI